jgi:hypothetical protein
MGGVIMALSVGLVAGDAAAGSAQAASVSVAIANMRVSKSGTTRQFLHDRGFTETAGVGVTQTKGKRCWSTGDRNVKAVNYRVAPNASLRPTNQVVIPVSPDEISDVTYPGGHDNDHPASLEFRVKISGEQFEVTP